MSLTDLAATITARKSADPDSSWTAKLFAKGPEKCAEKFGEEAVEAIIEAVKGDREGAALSPSSVQKYLGRPDTGGDRHWNAIGPRDNGDASITVPHVTAAALMRSRRY